MSKRPEYVSCIFRILARDRQTWCGRKLSMQEFAFNGIDHAAENSAQQGRLVACPECVAAVKAALTEG